MAEAIEGVEQILLELAQAAPGSSGEAFTPAPSWMDDLAVPLRAGRWRCTHGSDCAHFALHLRWHETHGFWTSTFLGARPSSCQSFTARGSRRAKQRWLIEEGAKLAVDLESSRTVQVGMTGHYVHLGARLDVTGRDLQAVKYRAGLMAEMIKPLRRLLRSPDLTEGEKTDMTARGGLSGSKAQRSSEAMQEAREAGIVQFRGVERPPVWRASCHRPTALTSWAQLRCRLPTEWALQSRSQSFSREFA